MTTPGGAGAGDPPAAPPGGGPPARGTATTWPADPGAPKPTGLSAATAEWPKKAADAVDLVVATIHDKAIRPVLLVARAIVFGLLVAVLSFVVLTLISVGLLRLLDVYVFPGRVWASYAVLGLVFSAGGVWAWSRRSAGVGDATGA